MNTLNRQSKLVLKHLQLNQHITPLEADGVYRIRRLASRIDELRRAGFEIATETKLDATGQRYTRYSLTKRQRKAKAPLGERRAAPTQMRLARLTSLYTLYLTKELGLEGVEAAQDAEDFIEFLAANA